jgi:DHA2 family multidrug resistance protein
VLLTRNVQINHAELAPAINPFNPNLSALSPGAVQGDPTALSQLDGLVNQQAAMIAYIDDFKLMMLVTLAAIPLALLLRNRAAAGRVAPAAAHMD